MDACRCCLDAASFVVSLAGRDTASIDELMAIAKGAAGNNFIAVGALLSSESGELSHNRVQVECVSAACVG